MGEKQKHCGSDIKTLWERFKNTVGEKQKHSGSVKALPLCFLSKYFAFGRVSTLTTRNNNRYIGTIYIK